MLDSLAIDPSPQRSADEITIPSSEVGGAISDRMAARNSNDLPSVETMTITVSKQFAENARGLATLFGYPDHELGEALESIAGWWLQTLRDDDGGELIATAESTVWRSEAACRTFAERLQKKLPKAEIKMHREVRGWSVEITPPGMILRNSRRATD